MASGAVDGNISLALRHPQLFSAVRAPEIPVLPVRQGTEQAPEKAGDPVHHSQEFLIFRPPFCLVSGEHTVITPDQQQDSHSGEDQAGHKKRYNDRRKGRKHGKAPQLIHAVTPFHEILQFISESVHSAFPSRNSNDINVSRFPDKCNHRFINFF
jgi:hypothetical protein